MKVSTNVIQMIDMFTTDLLHINEGNKNKLIDLDAGDLSKTLYLRRDDRESTGSYALKAIARQIGAVGSTMLRRSALVPEKEQIVGAQVNYFDWSSADGGTDTASLHKFVDSVYEEIRVKGNNPLFLSVGALSWEVSLGKDEIKKVKTPVIIFPIRLVRTGSSNAPLYIEFINDDIYINPCLTAKIDQMFGAEGVAMLKQFPHPSGVGVSVDEPVNIEALGDGVEYFERLGNFIKAYNHGDNTTFELLSDVVAISQYNHGDICMYYDIRRNKEKVYNSPLVERIFTPHDVFPEKLPEKLEARCVLSADSVQMSMIKRVVNGESIVIKGPPGTGKTLTIANMIASLLAAGKRVMLSSQKPAAMSEVFAKLPEPLRKFVMILRSETEAQTAVIKTGDVKKDLADLLEYAKNYKNNTRVHDDVKSAAAEIVLAEKEIKEYCQLVFGEKFIIGGNYYEALDVFCKCDVEPVLFAEPRYIMALSREHYNNLSEAVSTAAGYFDEVALDHPIRKSPWMPTRGTLSSLSLDAALNAYTSIVEIAKRYINEYEAVFAKTGIRGDNIRVRGAKLLLDKQVNEVVVNAIMNPLNKRLIEEIAKAFSEYTNSIKTSPCVVKSGTDAALLTAATANAGWDTTLSYERYMLIVKYWDVLKMFDSPVRPALLMGAMAKMDLHRAIVREYEEKLTAIYNPEFAGSNFDEIFASYDILEKYDIEKSPKAPGMLDFKAKRAYEALRDKGYGEPLSFVDVIVASRFAKKIADERAEIKAEHNRFSSMMHHVFTDEELALLSFAISRSAELSLDLQEYIQRTEKYMESANTALSVVEIRGNATFGDVYNAISSYATVSKLSGLLSRLGVFSAEEVSDVENTAELVIAVEDAVSSGVFGGAPEQIANNINLFTSEGRALIFVTEELDNALTAFARNHFSNYYTEKYSRATVSDLKILVKEALDKNIIRAASEYLDVIYGNNVLSLDRFFRPFEMGVRERGEYSFVDIFEHSVYHLAIKAVGEAIGNRSFGLGKGLRDAIANFQSGDAKMKTAQLQMIEQQCIARINPNAPEFAFLSAERSLNDTLRKLFKKNAREILSLKKCLIMSPSAVSMFLGNESYFDFDVVIVDEASQLEPTSTLPLLIRSRQAVLVGDEWQMPPMKHWTTKSAHEVVDEEGETMYMNPDMSVLSLALNNCAFPIERLVCHYRSRTESLISFSQRRFYDYMRTFPTPIPRAEGLGFKDLYIEDGYCENARNQLEAEAVVNELKLHFERYYKDGKLSEAVGVVAFGEKQLDLILSLVRADKELTNMMDTAKSNFDDLDEKLIFFKTIETVQGQETDHLIISLTYGKSKDGRLVQSFGELNRGKGDSKLGQCIFNVAVTRSRASVTFVHSVTSAEITNPSVDFLAEYLKLVERFGQDGRGQFVGDDIKDTSPGFIRQVAEYIVSLGVDESRVVINFGATEGSVRIPIAILAEDKLSAVLGIFCERDIEGIYDFMDYNSLYYGILSGSTRGWNMHRIFAHDWVDNRDAEKAALRKLIEEVK